MAQLKDYYNTGEDSVVSPNGANTWFAQTFTASASYTLNSIKLLVYRISTPGTITVELRNATGDSPPKPGNTIHATDTFDGDSITEDTGGEWKEVTFGTPYVVTSGTVYSIVIKAPSGDGSSPSLRWLYDANASPGLSGGNLARTTNGGGSWTDFAAHDALFETWTAAAVEYDEGIKIVAGAGVVSLSREGYRSPGGWPFDRFSDYDEDKYWDEANEQWVTSYVAGHGSRVDHVIFIGDQGEISFLEV